MIATVYKPSRRKNGKRIVGRMYRGKYRLDPRDKLKDVALHTNDKQIAEQRLRKIIQEEQRERDGIIAPKHQREAAQRCLAKHVEEYISDRRSVGRDEKYVRELQRKLSRLIDECSWQSVRQVSAESFCQWRAKQKKAAKTLNEYLNAICALMNWLEPRVGPNPLRFVEKVQANGARHRERRAFTANELQRLINISGMRGVVYLIAARTGIRRGELGQIEWRDVHLDTTQPFISVRASIAKNHKHAMQPLMPDAVDALRGLRPMDVQPTERVFGGLIPRMKQFRVDLEAAGIEYVDAKGEYADFHSLRKTFGTMLTLAGVGQRTVMELMRHSDMRLTAKTYTDANMLPISDAMALLTRFAASKQDSQIDSQKLVPASPSLSASVLLNAGETKLLSAGNETFSPSESASVPQSPQNEDHARCRVRTCDFLRVKQALYH
jgi:integrase